MAQAAYQPTFSAQDYLAWEPAQLDRHEYINGEVFAMAGAEDRHVTVAGNCYMSLRQHLSGSPCRTYMSDMRVHVAAVNSYLYPDVLVTCSALDLASPQSKSEPKLIIEVLSPSTAAYDRGLKFSQYRNLATASFCTRCGGGIGQRGAHLGGNAALCRCGGALMNTSLPPCTS